MRFSSFSLPGCLLLAAATLSGQGIVIVENQGPVQGSANQTSSKVHVEGNKLFVETMQDGKKQGFIFLGDEKVMRMLDFSNNTYREMTEEDFARLGDSMTQMQKMMEEKLKNMPPQQRKMVEQMMKQKMGAMPGAGAPSPTVYTQVASGQSVGKWTCDKYEGTRDGQKRWEVCTVGFDEFGVQPNDMQVFRDMAAMVKSMMPQGLDDMFQVGFEDQRDKGFQGVPVQRISYRNGAPNQKYEITDVSRQDIDDSLFEVPSGFKKQEMPGLGGR